MIVKCVDKYLNKQLTVIKWTFVFEGLGDTLGRFMVYKEHEDSHEVGQVYEVTFEKVNIND